MHVLGAGHNATVDQTGSQQPNNLIMQGLGRTELLHMNRDTRYSKSLVSRSLSKQGMGSIGAHGCRTNGIFTRIRLPGYFSSVPRNLSYERLYLILALVTMRCSQSFATSSCGLLVVTKLNRLKYQRCQLRDLSRDAREKERFTSMKLRQS
jgi:hypothetical protein